jgi:LacI family transcriptional regulator
MSHGYESVRETGGRLVTMSDVAREAGVSATTVSHVLNKSRRISPETELAVQRAIEKTGYVNDGIAKSLRTGKTKTIGLAVSAMSNPYFGDVVHAIEKQVTSFGHSLLLADTHDDPEHEFRAVTDLLAHRPEGLLIAPSADPQRALAFIARRHIPTVLIDRVYPAKPAWRFDAIGVENVEPTATLVAHLVSLGHSRIGMVTGQRGLQTTEERVQGFQLGHERHGLTVDPHYVQSGVSEDEPARAAIDALLGQRHPPTALVVGNNQMTIGSVRRLGERGVRVPEEMSIVSFDDFPWADLFHPRLTAMRQPVDQLGTLAVSMLFERLEQPDLDSRQLRLVPEFIQRDSSVPPSLPRESNT